MSKRAMAALAGIAVLAMLVASCGGSDEEPLTKAEFIEQGNAICREAAKEIEAKYKDFAQENDLELAEANRKQGMEIVSDIFMPAREQATEEFAELSLPEGDQQAEALVQALEQGVEKAEQQPKTLFEEKKYPFNEANEAAEKYGLKACQF